MRDLGWGRIKLTESNFGGTGRKSNKKSNRGGGTEGGGVGKKSARRPDAVVAAAAAAAAEANDECSKLKIDLETKLKEIAQENFILGHTYFSNVEYIILIHWDIFKNEWGYFWVPRLSEHRGTEDERYKQIKAQIDNEEGLAYDTVNDFNTVIQFLFSWFNVRETGIVVKEFNTPNDAFGRSMGGEPLDMQDYLNETRYAHINIDNDDDEFLKSLKSRIQQYFNECIVSKLDGQQITNVFDNFKTDPPEQSIATSDFNVENINPNILNQYGLGKQDPFEINPNVMNYDKNTSTFTFNLENINDPLTNVLLQLFMGDGYHDFAKKSGSRNIKNGKLNYIEQFWLGFIPSNNNFEYKKGENANYITNPTWLNVSTNFISYKCPNTGTLYYNKDVKTFVADVCREGICNTIIQVVTLANAVDAGSGSLKQICSNTRKVIRTDNMTVTFNLPPLSGKVRTITAEYTYTNKNQDIKIIYKIGIGADQKTYTYQSTQLLGAPEIAIGINAKNAPFTPNFIFLKFIGDFGRILYNYQMYKKDDNKNYYLYETRDTYSSRLAAIFSPFAYLQVGEGNDEQSKMGGFQAQLGGGPIGQAQAVAVPSVTQQQVQAVAGPSGTQQQEIDVFKNLKGRLTSYAKGSTPQSCKTFYDTYVEGKKFYCDNLPCDDPNYDKCTKLYEHAQDMWTKYCKRDLSQLRFSNLCPQPPGLTCQMQVDFGGRRKGKKTNKRDLGFGKIK